MIKIWISALASRGQSLGHRPWMMAIAACMVIVSNAIPAPAAAIAVPPSEPESTATELGQGLGFCSTDLTRALDGIVQRPQFASAQWSIVVEPVGETTPLYGHQPDLPLIPASTLKLLTTAATLRIIGDRAPQELPEFQPWIETVNRNSDNRAADALLRRIGGQSAVRQALQPLGIDPNSFVQVDGSGLSRQNRLPSSILTRVLQAMATDSTQASFYHSLPIGGVSGTLRNRFRDSPLQGRVRAKTGTLRGVRALAGYVENPAYGQVTFSILINQPGQTGPVMLAAIDDMVHHMAQVRRCF